MKIFYEIGDEEFWPFMTKKRTTFKDIVADDDLYAIYEEDGIIPDSEVLPEERTTIPEEDNTAVSKLKLSYLNTISLYKT